MVLEPRRHPSIVCKSLLFLLEQPDALVHPNSMTACANVRKWAAAEGLLLTLARPVLLLTEAGTRPAT